MTNDWWSVFTNGLWLTALAILLAAGSVAYYRAGNQEMRVRSLLARSPYATVLTVGGVLFFVGLAAVDDRWWATVLFGFLAIATAALFTRSRRQSSEG